MDEGITEQRHRGSELEGKVKACRQMYLWVPSSCEVVGARREGEREKQKEGKNTTKRSI